jgi:hypothetical protein
MRKTLVQPLLYKFFRLIKKRSLIAEIILAAISRACPPGNMESLGLNLSRNWKILCLVWKFNEHPIFGIK